MFAKARVATLEVEMQAIVGVCRRLTERVAAMEAQAQVGQRPELQQMTPLGASLFQMRFGLPGFPPQASITRYTAANAFPVGTRVRINGKSRYSWLGNIIERPANCREFGIRGSEAGPLVWLVSDHGRVYGIYPANVRRAKW